MSGSRYLLIAVVSFVTSQSWAASGCPAAVDDFKSAVSVYVKNGRHAFMERFLEGGPLLNQAGSEGEAQLETIERLLGPVQGGTVLSAKELGPRACHLVAMLEYTTGPAFLVSTYYTLGAQTAPTSLRLEGDPDKAFSIPALIQSR